MKNKTGLLKRQTGPGGSYHLFAGKDASRAFGKSSLKEEDAIPDYSDLNESELRILDDWVAFFSKKYDIVGRIVEPSKD
ncbi:hypothetical protein PORY_002166 [Pneumocystis oryctolagi]|uniref:Uncharacterized protein n=1 Tax=Pneumocystis oryctolagi TaxID=42067 RepID=A0ACB7C9R9_9ASCO|nr:hypothetical protein PORY_002166 [Pneumocystis oryctolagi]